MFRYLLLLLPATAAAVPTTITHQARVLDTSGTPLNGTYAVTLTLYDNADSVVYDTSISNVPIEQGYLSVTLGADGELDTDDLLRSPLFLGIQIGNDPELPGRQQLHATPYAMHAGGVTLGPVTTCNAAAEGTLRYDNGLFVCDGTSWEAISTGGNGTLASPARSCLDLHLIRPDAPDGSYYLTVGGTPTLAYCDMTFDGGGWTRVATVDGTLGLCNLSASQGSSTQIANASGNAWFEPGDVDALPWDGEIWLRDSSTNWTKFRSDNPAWSWSNVVNGIIHTQTVDDYSVEGWSEDQSTYAPLAEGDGCAPGGGWAGNCMLGGYPAPATWTVIMGIGRYGTGSFTQDAACQSVAQANGWLGMYGGNSIGWGANGQMYIR